MGLVPAARGSILLGGDQLLGLRPHAIVARGIGYGPQGRRVCRRSRSTSIFAWAAAEARQRVDAGARLRDFPGAGGAAAQWRRPAVGRRAADAGHRPRPLLANPRLLVMDEPSEGLAPIIIEQVEEILRRLVAGGEISVLLVEQNLGVANEVADEVACVWSMAA